MALNIRETGAETFVDDFDIQSGDRIEDRVHSGLMQCTELVGLLTPWSVDRNWVWSEMSGVWMLRKRLVAVVYGVTLEQVDQNHGGLAILASAKIIHLNEFDGYLPELRDRVRAADV
jgi:hypothetical protein